MEDLEVKIGDGLRIDTPRFADFERATQTFDTHLFILCRESCYFEGIVKL